VRKAKFKGLQKVWISAKSYLKILRTYIFLVLEQLMCSIIN